MEDKCSFCQMPFSEKEKELRGEIGRLRTELERAERELQATGEPEATDVRVRRALECAIGYGGTDGGHHKAWVIDQIVRWLTGDKYEEVVAEACAGEDGPNTYEWDVGIAP